MERRIWVQVTEKGYTQLYIHVHVCVQLSKTDMCTYLQSTLYLSMAGLRPQAACGAITEAVKLNFKNMYRLKSQNLTYVYVCVHTYNVHSIFVYGRIATTGSMRGQITEKVINKIKPI